MGWRYDIEVMPVPFNISGPFTFKPYLRLLTLLIWASGPVLAHGPNPSMVIQLEPLGLQSFPAQFLLAGSSMVTLDYVDNGHLLLTYSTRRLMKRLADDPPDDQDRFVEAVLLELPSGRALGRTSWRLHDHAQYLWNLGGGHFLLRIRNTLTTFSPLANLAAGQPFRERPFISTDRRIEGILLSPDADLLIVETSSPVDVSGAPAGPPPFQPSGKTSDEAPVQFSLFRLSVPLGTGDEIVLQPAGFVRARVPGRIPANAAGYLAIVDQGKQHWAFNFNSYGGKTRELAPFDSSCRPYPIFVSRSEFVAFGCHGGQTAQVIGAFNMNGEQMWEQTFLEPYTAATFAYAPAVGRFALSRIITHLQVNPSEPLSPEMVGNQSVVVYQTDSGKQILRVESTPVQRAGQNFSLSPDGLSLAIIHGNAIEIYGLPQLTSKEQAVVKQAETMSPDQNDSPIRSSGSVGTSEETDRSAQPASTTDSSSKPDHPPAPVASAPAPRSTSDGRAADPSTSVNTSPGTSDPAPQEQPRKPPTLYNSPTDPPRPESPK